MINIISGELISAKPASLTLLVGGSVGIEVLVPPAIIQSLPSTSKGTEITLVTYFYLQIEQSKGVPVIIGFLTENQRDFFEEILRVASIGPKTAVKAMSEPVSNIARAIESGDIVFLTRLSGIGKQKAKEIVAKLQGKVTAYMSEEDRVTHGSLGKVEPQNNCYDEVLIILQQLQYTKTDADYMIKRAMQQNPDLSTTEEVLDAIYKNN